MNTNLDHLTPEEKANRRREYKKEWARKNKHKAKAYAQANKEKVNARNRAWRNKNKERVKQYESEEVKRERGKKYYEENKEILSEKGKEYYEKNKEVIIARNKKWAEANPEKVKAYKKKNLETNINTKLSYICRKRIVNALNSNFTRKNSKTRQLLGCDVSFLKEHLEKQFKPGMTWDNYGKKGWVIDHIVPCALFDLTKEWQQKSCFNWQNLQPLWWDENLKKSDTLEVCPV